MRTLEDTLRSLAAQLPLDPGALLRSLGEERCQSWDELVALEPCRELPRLVAREVRPAIDREELDGFVEAHQIGVLFGFVADRLADGEADGAPQTHAAREALAGAWVSALSGVLGSPGRAARAVRRARCAFSSAVSLEEKYWRPRGLTPEGYARICCAKLYWAGLPTRALLAAHAPEQVRPFSQLFRVLVGGLQLCDDALDAEQDRLRRGACAGEVLGLPQPALMLAASILNARGAQLAECAGLTSLAGWFEGRSRDLSRIASQGDLAARLAAQALAASFLAQGRAGAQ